MSPRKKSRLVNPNLLHFAVSIGGSLREKSRAWSQLCLLPETLIHVEVTTSPPCEEPDTETAADTDMAKNRPPVKRGTKPRAIRAVSITG